jgi:hypothetical protein
MGDDGSGDSEDDNEDPGNDGNENTDDENGNNGEDEQAEPATFEVGNVTFTEATIAAQTEVELSAQITNSGGQTATKTVELRQDGEMIDSQEVELEAGGEQTVSFSPSTDLSTGEYEFTVLTADSEGTSVLTIAEGEFAVENLDPQLAELTRGQPLTVSADIVNQGPVRDTKPIELRVDGETIDEQERTLGAEEQQPVEFDGVETSSLSLDVEEHSIWTPDNEAQGSLTLMPIEPGTLDLSVVNSEDVGIGQATVTGDGIDETTADDGTLTLELDPGEYELTISSGELQATRTVTIEGGEPSSLTVELVASATGSISSFDGTNTSGYTAFGEESKPEDPTVQFPPGDVTVNGTVSDGEWESTSVEFEELTVRGLPTQVEAINGLSGTFDEEQELMTVEGELQVAVGSDDPSTFSYSIAATTEQSGALTGSADFSGESGTATIVDNEYTVNDTTGDIVDDFLGLPIEESGKSWLELSLNFDFQRE